MDSEALDRGIVKAWESDSGMQIFSCNSSDGGMQRYGFGAGDDIDIFDHNPARGLRSHRSSARAVVILRRWSIADPGTLIVTIPAVTDPN
jgi:hypothetical protein